MILFRADANPKIGTGHIMRCLSLADALQKQGKEIAFVTAEPYFQPMIQAHGYLCTVLRTSYENMEEELPLFRSILEQDRPELVVLDSYFVTPRYMETVKNTARLLYIDDLNMFDYPADIVVNYNIYGPEIAYPQNKTYLLGPQYAPLRKEFQGLERHIIRERVRDVLISTGGTDQYHVALRCAEYLQRYPPSENGVFHFVVGAMNRDRGELEEFTKGIPFIKLHCQVTDMCSLMLRCDAAVSAGGTTLFELCACGLPTMTYILADNQIRNANSFAEGGLMLCSGDIRERGDFAAQIFETLDILTSDCVLRQRMAEQMQAVVDGNGAARIAGIVCGGELCRKC